MPDIAALDRLKSQLLTSGIQQKNIDLFQIINQLIDFLRQTITLTAQQIAAITPAPGGPTTIKLTTLGSPAISDGEDGLEGPIGPQGLQGKQGLIGPIGPPGLDVLDFDGGDECLPPLGNLSEYALKTIDNAFRVEQNITGLVKPSLRVRERGRAVSLGEWTSPAYNAGDYTASAGNWTVEAADVITYAYTLIGTTMVLLLWVQNTTVSATPNDLRVVIPGGYSAAKYTLNTCQIRDNAGATLGQAWAAAGGTVINFRRYDGAAWATAADTTDVKATIIIELQ